MVRLAVLLIVLTLGVGAFALPFAHSLADRRAAREDLRAAEAGLREAQARRASLADRLAALRSQADQVEIAARAEFRLILPGERFELIRGAQPAPLLAHHSPRERVP